MSLFTPRSDVLTQRIAAVRSAIVSSLSDPKPLDDVHALSRDLDLLESLARRRSRRQSIKWAVFGVALLIAMASLLAARALSTAEIRIVAETRAFVLSGADRTENLLVDTVTLASITTDSSGGAECRHVAAASSPTCAAVADLRLNTISLHPDSTVAVRADGACIEADVVAGGANINFTWASLSASSERQWSAGHLTFPPGGSMRICPDTTPTLRYDGSTAVVLSRRTGAAANDQELIPSIATGVVAIKTTEQSSALFRTDMLRAGDIRQSLLVATLADPIAMAFDGRVGTLEIVDSHGASERSLMPTWLDWLANSPTVTVIAAVFGAIVSFVMALRERFLSE
jgi:hypothetical protein